MPFSSSRMCALITDEFNLDFLAEVVFVRFLHNKIPLSLCYLYCTLPKKVTKDSSYF